MRRVDLVIVACVAGICAGIVCGWARGVAADGAEVFAVRAGTMPTTVPAGAEEEGFVALFDGRTMEGWEGKGEVFRIEEEAVVGGSLQKGLARNEFLCTRKEYGDFELRLKFKLLGKGANGGIQIRSKRVAGSSEVSGYQADLAEGCWGNLYDESRRNRNVGQADQSEVQKIVRAEDWNEYRIVCRGRRFQLWINGMKTVDYTETDESLPQRGVIGLQIHGGGPSEAWYKEVRIREMGE